MAPGAELLSPPKESSARRGGDAVPTVQAHPLERPEGAHAGCLSCLDTLIPNCWRAVEVDLGWEPCDILD